MHVTVKWSRNFSPLPIASVEALSGLLLCTLRSMATTFTRQYLGISISLICGLLAPVSCVMCGAFGFLLFQKKLLSHALGRHLARLAVYPSLPATMALRADNYFTDLGGHVFLGGAPVAWCGHLDRLRDLGVTGVINLMDEYTGPLEQYNACGIIQLHLRVVAPEENSPHNSYNK